MRYYLHIRDRAGSVRDEDGSDYHGLIAAVDEAQRGIRSLLSEGIKAGTFDLDGYIEIAGEDGAPILVVPFSNAITIMLPGRLAIMDDPGEQLD